MTTATARLHELIRTGPVIMGIVNVTPDSFSDGGAFFDEGAAIRHGIALLEAGAGILDIGGESTRPGAATVPPEDEQRRVVPVIAGLRAAASAVGALISVDTRNAATMAAAAAAGADILNDITALEGDPDSLSVAAEIGLPVILMHMQGEPQTMQASPHYDDVLGEVMTYLEERMAACIAAGIPRERLVIDPGIGFGKTLAHNLELLRHLDRFRSLGVPLLLGASRKTFIGKLDRNAPPDERLGGSVAVAILGAAKGAAIIRVHDVAETRQALAVWRAAMAGA
jgi:dihydropteroate synthase